MKRTAALVCALLGTALVAVPGGTSAQAAASKGFYTPPSTLPAANGTIIRSEPQELNLWLDDLDGTKKLSGRATRIMYKSTDAAGRPVAVTGTFIDPATRWTGRGQRPLIAFASGTQGAGDTCAPSKVLESTVTVEEGSLGIGYEAISIQRLLDAGIAVVATDYIGLGTTDRLHTYTTRLDLGHAVLDSVRAARNLDGTSLGTSPAIGLYGYSEGGGATGAASELAATYAPELKIRGAYVGGPPADLMSVLRTVDGTLPVGVVAYAINGLAEYSPELRSVLRTETNAAGKEALANARRLCTLDSMIQYRFQKTSDWTVSGRSAAEVVSRYPGVKAFIEKQRLGTVKPSFPTMVLVGTQDDVVGGPQAKQLARDWCARGANVTYDPVVQLVSSAGFGINHVLPIFEGGPRAEKWLVDRFDGVPARSSCALVDVLP